MNKRHVVRVRVQDLRIAADVVFYAANPDEHPNVLPEYMNLSDRHGHELVWVVYFGEKNPYLAPVQPAPLGDVTCFRGLINSLESDWF